MGDHATAMALFGAVMMALYQRDAPARGHGVDVPDGGRALVERHVRAAHLCGATVRQRPPRGWRSMPSGTCTDAAMTAGSSSPPCRRSASGPVSCALDRPDLAEDARFATLGARRKHVHNLVAKLDEIFARARGPSGASDWTRRASPSAGSRSSRIWPGPADAGDPAR
jgi:crotonobetainyl-CoA:carnitine CoA-transferase CaiB-like acyl-CoA transferase